MLGYQRFHSNTTVGNGYADPTIICILTNDALTICSFLEGLIATAINIDVSFQNHEGYYLRNQKPARKQQLLEMTDLEPKHKFHAEICTLRRSWMHD